jgi:tetratricopeptide (TPR) repeat protein
MLSRFLTFGRSIRSLNVATRPATLFSIRRLCSSIGTPTLSHEARQALIVRGLAASRSRHFEEAMQLFDEARDVKLDTSNVSTLTSSTTTTLDAATLQQYAVLFNNRGEVMRQTGQLAQSRKELEASIQMFEFVSDADRDHLAYSSALNNLGLTLVDMMLGKEAIEPLRKSLELRRIHGDANDVATVLNNIGLAYSHNNQFSDASDAYQAALSIVRDPRFQQNVGVSEVYLLGNIGLMQIHEKKYEAALETLLDAEAKSLANSQSHGDSGVQPADFASLLNNVALALYHLKRYNKSHEYYKRAIDIFVATLGETHPRLYSIYVNFATLCARMKGRDAAREGKEASMKAKAIAERVLATKPASSDSS